MRKLFTSATFLLAVLLIMASTFSINATGKTAEDKISVLILSGKNNHEWQKTTPALKRMLGMAGTFLVEITDRPDTLKYPDFKKFHLIVSNWNSWPDNNMEFGKDYKNGFEQYIKEGGGALFFHAGASSFYGWDTYHRIGMGRWGKETFHNAPVCAHVYQLDQKHPITKGIKGFFIQDEIWEKTELFPGISSLGSLKAVNAKDGHPIDEPAFFVNQVEKGRSFYTILGHDERALLNNGLQALLIRASQWCAGRTVTFAPDPELQKLVLNIKDGYSWNT